jgi:hypothetical protein
MCKDIFAINAHDSLIVILLKNLPEGMTLVNKWLGFNMCDNHSDIFNRLVDHLEPVVYFITSFL